MPEGNEFYICVDVETAGPNPADFALLSIGACTVFEPEQTFYIELKPTSNRFSKEALEVNGLSLKELKVSGIPAKDAMRQFDDWLQRVLPENGMPVFVAFNAPFDWMFINSYFHRYLGSNPFGHSALDIKAYYMGKTGLAWSETSMRHVSTKLLKEKHLTHNALHDAQDQAEIFYLLMKPDRS